MHIFLIICIKITKIKLLLRQNKTTSSTPSASLVHRITISFVIIILAKCHHHRYCRRLQCHHAHDRHSSLSFSLSIITLVIILILIIKINIIILTVNILILIIHIIVLIIIIILMISINIIILTVIILFVSLCGG